MSRSRESENRVEKVNDRLKNRAVIVTGSGQGIGRAIAIAMVKESAMVVTNSRKPGTPGGDAETTAREIKYMGGQATPFFGDISDFEEARKLIQTTVDNFGRVDILVNNAGIATVNTAWNTTEAEWDQVVNSSLKGSFNCIRHASGLMIQQRWGRIINTTSAAWLGTMELCSYSAAKAGVVGLTRAVARDVGSYGITCNAYAPSAATRMSASPELIALYKKKYETGFFSKEQYEAVMNQPSPETVTPLLVYLCTDEAADINGQVFEVSGSDITIYSEPVRKRAIFKTDGLLTVDELIDLVPRTLLEGYKNPAPTSV